jgi:hypothetical protein
MKVTGTAIKFGDNVDTDVMLPGKYLVLIDPMELAKHAMEGLDPDFPEKASPEVFWRKMRVSGVVCTYILPKCHKHWLTSNRAQGHLSRRGQR